MVTHCHLNKQEWKITDMTALIWECPVYRAGELLHPLLQTDQEKKQSRTDTN